MNNQNIIAGAINFGLGPIGKLSSIISCSRNINWFACGDKLDLSIFQKNPFNKCLWSKEADRLKDFCNNNKINTALIILDPELAKILLEVGLKVVYVDSLPFLWTENDIIPCDATYYCAQLCLDIPIKAGIQLSKINNLKWVSPIVPRSINLNSYNSTKFILINFGGLHSPNGSAIDYVKIVLTPIIGALEKVYNYDIIITCGSKISEEIKELIFKNKLDHKLNVSINTLNQKEFLQYVKESYLFITSPGLTTLYETAYLNKSIIVLPPQNLSQFYNIEFAKRMNSNYNIIEWEEMHLSNRELERILYLGENFVVNYILKRFQLLVTESIVFEDLFEKTTKAIKNGIKSLKSELIFEMNGAGQVLEYIEKLK